MFAASPCGRPTGDGPTFDLDPARWPELAADRGAWRAMLRSGEAPLGFRQAPPVPVPMQSAASQREAWARKGIEWIWLRAVFAASATWQGPASV